jgi:hypothetical protein
MGRVTIRRKQRRRPERRKRRASRAKQKGSCRGAASFFCWMGSLLPIAQGIQRLRLFTVASSGNKAGMRSVWISNCQLADWRCFRICAEGCGFCVSCGAGGWGRSSGGTGVDPSRCQFGDGSVFSVRHKTDAAERIRHSRHGPHRERNRRDAHRRGKKLTRTLISGRSPRSCGRRTSWRTIRRMQARTIRFARW